MRFLLVMIYLDFWWFALVPQGPDPHDRLRRPARHRAPSHARVLGKYINSDKPMTEEQWARCSMYLAYTGFARFAGMKILTAS
jgi:hypothetical protein